MARGGCWPAVATADRSWLWCGVVGSGRLAWFVVTTTNVVSSCVVVRGLDCLRGTDCLRGQD
jgi:hypothetical protein